MSRNRSEYVVQTFNGEDSETKSFTSKKKLLAAIKQYKKDNVDYTIQQILREDDSYNDGEWWHNSMSAEEAYYAGYED